MNYPHFKWSSWGPERLGDWSGVIKWGLVGERRGLRQGPWTSWSAFQPDGPEHQPPLSCTAAAPATGGRFRARCSHTARVRTWRLLTVHPAVTSCIRRVICGFLYSSHSFSFIKKIMVYIFWSFIFECTFLNLTWWRHMGWFFFFNFPWKPAERMFWVLFFFFFQFCQVDISVWYWQEHLYSVGGCSPDFQA